MRGGRKGGFASTPTGGPRERCPFSGDDLSAMSPLESCEQLTSQLEYPTLDLTGREAPHLPLRGARGSAAQISVMTLVWSSLDVSSRVRNRP